MKAYKTLLFIVAVFVLLSIAGLIIPSDGIKIGDANITFPSAIDVMRGSAEDGDADADEVDQETADAKAIWEHIEEQKMSVDMKLRLAAIRHEHAIKFPNDSIEWLDNVFAALENAKNQPVRIIHYGDSQIEEDRMTSDLRALLQKLFGGYGVGLLPAIQTIPTSAIGQSCSPELKKYIVYGNRSSLKSRSYGVLGQTVQLDGTAHFSFYKVSMGYTKPGTKKFGNVSILLNDITKPVTATISYGSTVKTKEAASGSSLLKFYLPDSTRRVRISLSGTAKIDGFILDGNEKGVSVDNVAMRGCSGTIFTSISGASLRRYYGRYNVPLIILQFGGNSVPFTKSKKSIDGFCQTIDRQLKYLHKISPNSRILFVGPSDMSTFINGSRQTYKQIPDIIDALKKTCMENNVAYWDLYEAMGGKNSMIQWVKSNLAGSDHIHFTNKGARTASEKLYESLMSAYKYYVYRREK